MPRSRFIEHGFSLADLTCDEPLYDSSTIENHTDHARS